MSSPDAHGALQIGVDVLKTTRDEKTKAVLAQTGDAIGQTTDADGVEWWQTTGFVSTPSDPEPGQAACQAVVLRRGDRDVAIAARDLRGLELAGQLAAGETCLYAAGTDGQGQARFLLKGNGSVNIYTRAGNSPTGAGMGIFVNPEDDSVSIINSQGYGLLIKSDGVYITSTNAALKLTADGAASLIGTQQTQVDGASVVIGSQVVPVANAALKGPSGSAGTPSVKVLIE